MSGVVRIGLFLATILQMNSVWGNLQLPLNFEQLTGGFTGYSVVQCPRADEFSSDFLTQLQQLKNSISSEANCEPVSVNVDSLSDLVTTGQGQFRELIQKGTTQGLSERESETLRGYVQNLTTTTASLLQVLSGNDACFEEDRQLNSLSFISSLISEGSQIMGILDPSGGTVAVAGSLLSGFLDGLQDIQEVGYDFTQHENRVAYNDTLCAFYNFKQEFNQYLFAETQVRRLQEVNALLERQLRRTTANCVECTTLQQSVEQSARNNEQFGFDSNLGLFIETDVDQWASDIDSNYGIEMGTRTLQTARAQQWVGYRIETLRNASFQADLNLQHSLQLMDDIENFLIEREAPKFLSVLIAQARDEEDDLFDHISRTAFGQIIQLYDYLGEEELPSRWIMTGRGGTKFPVAIETYEELFPLLNHLEELALRLRRSSDRNDLVQRAGLMSYLDSVDYEMIQVVSALQLAVRYCDFFLYSQQWYNSSISSVCEGSRIRATRSFFGLFPLSIYRSRGSLGVTEMVTRLEEISASQQGQMGRSASLVADARFRVQSLNETFVESIPVTDPIESWTLHLMEELEAPTGTIIQSN